MSIHFLCYTLIIALECIPSSFLAKTGNFIIVKLAKLPVLDILLSAIVGRTRVATIPRGCRASMCLLSAYIALSHHDNREGLSLRAPERQDTRQPQGIVATRSSHAGGRTTTARDCRYAGPSNDVC